MEANPFSCPPESNENPDFVDRTNKILNLLRERLQQNRDLVGLGPRYYLRDAEGRNQYADCFMMTDGCDYSNLRIQEIEKAEKICFFLILYNQYNEILGYRRMTLTRDGKNDNHLGGMIEMKIIGENHAISLEMATVDFVQRLTTMLGEKIIWDMIDLHQDELENVKKKLRAGLMKIVELETQIAEQLRWDKLYGHFGLLGFKNGRKLFNPQKSAPAITFKDLFEIDFINLMTITRTSEPVNDLISPPTSLKKGNDLRNKKLMNLKSPIFANFTKQVSGAENIFTKCYDQSEEISFKFDLNIIAEALSQTVNHYSQAIKFGPQYLTKTSSGLDLCIRPVIVDEAKIENIDGIIKWTLYALAQNHEGKIVGYRKYAIESEKNALTVGGFICTFPRNMGIATALDGSVQDFLRRISSKLKKEIRVTLVNLNAQNLEYYEPGLSGNEALYTLKILEQDRWQKLYGPNGLLGFNGQSLTIIPSDLEDLQSLSEIYSLELLRTPGRRGAVFVIKNMVRMNDSSDMEAAEIQNRKNLKNILFLMKYQV